MTTAFVLSGGGSLGAVQVGMLQALAAEGIHPDLLLGTSAGAINAAYVAGHGTSERALADLAAVWTTLRRAEVFPFSPGRVAAAALGRSTALCSNAGLHRLLARHLNFAMLEDAAVPVHVVATDIRSGQEVLLSSGDAIAAVMASAAIPGIFPTVRVGAADLTDGGIADNAAVSQAVALGAERIYVLPGGYACALERPPATALASAMHALTLLITQRLAFDVAAHSGQADIRLIPPLCPLAVSSADFGHAAELIARSRAATTAWLQSGGDRLPHGERFLSRHRHPGRAVAVRKVSDQLAVAHDHPTAAHHGAPGRTEGDRLASCGGRDADPVVA